MKRIKLLLMTVLLLLSCATMQAQFGERLGKAIKKSAEDATVRKAEQKTEQGVSKTIDKVTDPDSYKDKDKDKDKDKESKSAGDAKESSGDAPAKSSGNDQSGNAAPAEAKQQPQPDKSPEMVYAKSDFVPGDVIIFDDEVANEQMGEFPSQWDLMSGVAEVLSINGAKAISVQTLTEITPLMKTPKNYLPEVFTVEMDFFAWGKERAGGNDGQVVSFRNKNDQYIFEITLRPLTYGDNLLSVRWGWASAPGEGEKYGALEVPGITQEAFHRLSISFNKRALKIYIDGSRVANVPNSARPSWFYVRQYGDGQKSLFIKNIRIAEGAVPLYDRMMSDGKIVTYGITFDVGKSTIKPESMSEINRIAELMKANPDLKFSVEGHTDSTGSAASNQTLSDARSKAVVEKLVAMGITADRLKSAGKGQNTPLADNATDEGRAKNRRVEFVKM